MRSDKKKRLSIFNLFNKKHKGFVFIQETHSTIHDEIIWKREWGGDILFAHGSSKSRGVAILIPSNIDYKINSLKCDVDGRYIIIDIDCFNNNYIFINVYAPTQDKEKEQLNMLNVIQENLADLEDKNIILGGDLNIIINPMLDKKGGSINQNFSIKYRTLLTSFIEHFELSDIWRQQNENKTQFTWHCKKKKIYSRLDYFFISEHLSNLVKKSDIIPCVLSDHNIIILSLKQANENKRGPGYWKFNVSLLRDKVYTHMIQQVIIASKAHHSINDKAILWDMIKMDIRIQTIIYCKAKKKEHEEYEQALEHELKLLQSKILTDNVDFSDRITAVEHELISINNERIAGIMIRSKAQWAEEGEKCSSFFLNLEKRNYQNKCISQLNINGTIITDPNKISLEENKFYTNLYSENKYPCSENNIASLKVQFFNNHIPTLTNDAKEYCEVAIDEHTCAEAIMKLKNGKTPGLDGLPVDFYKFFWKNIKHLIVDSIAYSFEKGTLTNNQKNGILTLIPKKDKDRMFLKNWRPLTLLTTDYKIITKILAMHMSKVLPKIIDNDQTGYLKGRYIGENIRTISDIIDYCKIKNRSAVLLLIDFEKAFDTVNWKYLHKTLVKFNFGKIFRKWIQIIYKDVRSYILNNGHFSPSFEMLRGIRQGCPLSAYLFLLVVEILAINIRVNGKIKGIKLRSKEVKISQLADDTTLILDSCMSIAPLKILLDKFALISGLKTNIDKTQAFLIGKHTKFKNNYGMTWSDGPINVLGISICQTSAENIKFNYESKISKIKTILNIWKQRNLSLKGKIIIINNLAASILVYPLSIIDTPDTIIEQVDKLFFDFLWANKPSKISRNTIIREIDNGGLKMIDIKSKMKSLKFSWITRALAKPDSTWKLILDDILNDVSFDYLVKCTNIQNKYYKKLPEFYKGILTDLIKLRKLKTLKTPLFQEITAETLWFNNNITVDRVCIFWRKWYIKGIKYISDLINTRGEFMKISEINETYNINCTFMDHLRIRQSIPGIWRKILTTEYHTNVSTNNSNALYITYQSRACDIITLKSKCLYWMLIDVLVNGQTPTCITRWNSIYPIDKDIWPDIFVIPFKSCRETYLQTFQYKIINRILACNKWLHQLKIINTDKCTYQFCNEPAIDDIQHHLISCPPVITFWQHFVSWWNCLDYQKLHPLAEENIILGFPCHTNEDIVINFCLIIAKITIYNCKRHSRPISIIIYLQTLKEKLMIEERINIKNGTTAKFECIWGEICDTL